MSNTHLVSIASKSAIERRVQDFKRRDDSVKSRVAPILKKFWDPQRPLISGADTKGFDELASRFPNFKPVIAYWKSVAMASRRLEAPFLPDPVLLGGLPGLGKTYFASEAAKVMSLPFSEISIATLTASFVISGGSLQWGDGSPGFIAKSLAESDIGNPMVLMDEVDKAMQGNYSPMGPFYPLLERHSAKRFRDEALDIEMDASNVIWVATANDIGNIPAPILSRMKYFQIMPPAQDEMHVIVKNMYRLIREKEAIGQLLDEVLPQKTMDLLTVLLPREARKVLHEACMNAFLAERSTVTEEDVVMYEKPERSRMGFL